MDHKGKVSIGEQEGFFSESDHSKLFDTCVKDDEAASRVQRFTLGIQKEKERERDGQMVLIDEEH